MTTNIDIRPLIEFLYARIEEDEERARLVLYRNEGTHHRPLRPWALSHDGHDDLLCIEPSRALAEAYARRQNIAAIRRWIDAGYLTLDIVLRHMALAYVSHPDYRPEWRPVHLTQDWPRIPFQATQEISLSDVTSVHAPD